uniref:hypothetical protein n=1 Tax=Spongiibacter marinus TaxID=354246 RepID=UPI0035BE9FD3
AQQRLERHRAGGLKVDDRLILHEQFVLRKGALDGGADVGTPFRLAPIAPLEYARSGPSRRQND